MTLVVALAVQVYSIGYLQDDPRYPSYSAFISLFTSAMLLVVYAGDLLVLYVGWEIMGLCSYLLIGHWWEDRANSRAAVKAFLVTRLGDVGFLFGIFVLGRRRAASGSPTCWRKVPEMSAGTLVAATHAAARRGRGQERPGAAAHLAARRDGRPDPDQRAHPRRHHGRRRASSSSPGSTPPSSAARPTLDVLAVLAALGMLGAALAALAQDDLKRVLAYSTISQLAYMAGGLAAGSDTGGDLPPDHARRVQGAAVPLRGRRDPPRRLQPDEPRWAGCAGSCRSRSWTMTIGFAALDGPASGQRLLQQGRGARGHGASVAGGRHRRRGPARCTVARSRPSR